MSRSLSFVCTAMAVLAAGTSQAGVFYAASFPDHTRVELSLDGAARSLDPGFDFDVRITLAESGSIRDAAYVDSAKHKASVRCSLPGEVRIGDVTYSVSENSAHDDWKVALWRAICMSPAA